MFEILDTMKALEDPAILKDYNIINMRRICGKYFSQQKIIKIAILTK